MDSLINVNSKEVEKKLSIMRRYPQELIVIVLCAVSGYLFVGMKSNEKDIRDYMRADKTELIQNAEITKNVIIQNSEQLKQNSEALLQIIDIINEKKYTK